MKYFSLRFIVSYCFLAEHPNILGPLQHSDHSKVELVSSLENSVETKVLVLVTLVRATIKWGTSCGWLNASARNMKMTTSF